MKNLISTLRTLSIFSLVLTTMLLSSSCEKEEIVPVSMANTAQNATFHTQQNLATDLITRAPLEDEIIARPQPVPRYERYALDLEAIDINDLPGAAMEYLFNHELMNQVDLVAAAYYPKKEFVFYLVQLSDSQELMFSRSGKKLEAQIVPALGQEPSRERSK